MRQLYLKIYSSYGNQRGIFIHFPFKLNYVMISVAHGISMTSPTVPRIKPLPCFLRFYIILLLPLSPSSSSTKPHLSLTPPASLAFICSSLDIPSFLSSQEFGTHSLCLDYNSSHFWIAVLPPPPPPHLLGLRINIIYSEESWLTTAHFVHPLLSTQA